MTFNPLPGRKQFRLGDAPRAQQPLSRPGEDRDPTAEEAPGQVSFYPQQGRQALGPKVPGSGAGPGGAVL